MKTFKTFLLFAFVSVNIVWAQDYIPFPKSNAHWCDGVYYYWPVPSDTTYGFYKTNGTAIINDTTYTVIDLYDNANYCYYRELNKRVFLRYNVNTPEILLYDFNLEVGDTFLLPQVVEQNVADLYEGTVAFIDSLLVGDKFHKRYYIENNEWISLYFIEGIGSTMGLLYCELPWVDWEGTLECFSLNDSIFDLDGSGGTFPGNCWQFVNIKDVIPEKLCIYPNPTYAKISITGASNCSYELRDLLGKIIYQTNNSTLDLLNLPPNVYILKIYSVNNQLISQDKIIKLSAR